MNLRPYIVLLQSTNVFVFGTNWLPLGRRVFDAKASHVVMAIFPLHI